MPPQRFLHWVAALLIAIGPAVAQHQQVAVAAVHAPVARTGLSVSGSPPRAVLATSGGLRREVFGFALASSLSDPVVGVPTWNFTLLSTVAFFGLHVNWDGTIVSDSGLAVWNSSALTALVSTAHANAAKVVVTIVLQDFSPGTPNMCAGLINRAKTVSQTVAQVAAKSVDGVNVDYEGLNGTCQNGETARAMMTDFVRQLRAALPSSAYLSVDTYASSAIDSVGFFDIGGLAPYVDSFFVMAYDLEYSNWKRSPLGCGSFCLSPTAPLSGYYYNDTTTISQYLSVTPASKMILGVPYYGRKACVSSAVANAWVLSGTVAADSYLSATQEISSPDVRPGSYATHRDAHDPPGQERWDTWYNTTLGCTRELYWDDKVSLSAKYDLVNQRGLRGVGIWNLNYGGGATELWQLLRSHFAGCSAVTASASPASAALAGTTVTVTASATCQNPNPLYEFWMLAPGATSYTLAQAYSTNPVLSWKTAGLASGTYRINVWARDANSTGAFANSSGTWDAYDANLYYSVTSKPCAAVGEAAWPQTAAMVGVQVSVTASSTGCPNPLYEFWILPPGASAYTLAQAYSTNPILTWSTTGRPAGSYRVNVWVRDTSSVGLSGNIWGRWDAYNANLVYTLMPGCPSVTQAASPASPAGAGVPVTVTASATGCPNPLYEFWILAPGASLYTLAQAYSTKATFSWNTSSLAAGTYRINVWVRDSSSAGQFANSSGRWDAYNATVYYAIEPTCRSVSESSPTAAASPGTVVAINAVAVGCPNPLYEFWVLAPGASLYTLVQGYGGSSVLDWHTTGLAAGTYRINVWVRDASSSGIDGNSYGRWDAYSATLVITVT